MLLLLLLYCYFQDLLFFKHIYILYYFLLGFIVLRILFH